MVSHQINRPFSRPSPVRPKVLNTFVVNTNNRVICYRFRFSNSSSSKTTSLAFCIKRSIDSSLHDDNFSKKVILLFLQSEHNSTKIAKVSLWTDLKILIQFCSSTLPAPPSWKNHSWQTFTGRGLFQKISVFCFCILILTIQICRKCY